MTRELLNALGAAAPAEEESPPCLKGGAPQGRGDIPSSNDAAPECSESSDSIPQSASPTAPFRQGGLQGSGGIPQSGRFASSQHPSGKEAIEDAEAAPAQDPHPESAPEPPDLREHFGRLLAQSEALRREFADFDPAAALRDPDFLRLTAPGLGVDARRAWLALHPELLERRAAAASAAALARSLASGAARPREGGGRSGGDLAADYRSLPRAEQQRLKERIHRAAALGEKIYP